MSQLISIDELAPGMVIVRIVEQNGPVKIRKSGLVTSTAMVQGLAEMGVLALEIDPEQTVEIDKPAPKQHRTQTQALLRGQYDTGIDASSAMSEQFNRSLFLPTVQSLPNLWQRHAKTWTRLAGIVVIGFVIGFVGAQAPKWVSFEPQEQITTSTTVDDKKDTAVNANLTETLNQPSAQVNVTPMANTVTPEQVEVVNQQNTSANSSPSLTQSANENSISQVDTQNQAQTQTNAQPQSPEQEQPKILGYQPDTAQSQAGQPQFANNSAYPEGEVLNEQSDDKNVDISPELLAKFNQAIEEIDNERDSGTSAPKPVVNVHNDVQRVDQLPVRMLTQLPSMAFSAHMYASNPADRWVRVNGKQMGEGDWITDEVQIVHIDPQKVIMRFRGEEFSMAALTDW